MKVTGISIGVLLTAFLGIAASIVIASVLLTVVFNWGLSGMFNVHLELYQTIAFVVICYLMAIGVRAVVRS